MKIDLIIKNANVITLDAHNRRAGSVAVSNGRIVGIWNSGEPPRGEIEISTHTEVVDLKGMTLIPGFIDTHNHLLMYSQLRNHVNCSTPNNKNMNDILNKIKEAAQEKQQGEWIQGWGYDDTLLDEMRHPTREELDRVAPHHPVFIRHISGHFAAVNSLALAMAGIDEQVVNPRGGFFGRDHNGRLDGVLHELPAMETVQSVLPVLSEDRLATLVGDGAHEYLSLGITTNTDAGVGLDQGISEFNAHLKAVETGRNPLKMRMMVMHHLLRKGSPFGEYSAVQLDQEIQARSRGRARLDSAKLFQDGSIQGLTAALRTPYECAPDLYGELLHDQGLFNQEVLDLHQRGYRIAIHGNGDRAIESILDAFEYALYKHPRGDHRHRIEHAQTANIVDLNRMKSLDVAVSFFINHVYYWGDRHKRRFLGAERAERMNPLADAVEREILFTLHSDCPITPISPLFSVWSAVNRLTRERQILGRNQVCDVETALKAMTSYGARINFEENETGSIEVGKCADFAVLDIDPTACDKKEIKDICVLATFIDGNMVFQRSVNYMFS
ncbi:amidohydrolase [Ammoniphilus sp. 3BR4]|uniref:amidohydrolase n=1 Tax=Ammoniphilus sp. 3BR4 TaxID=3158265 RepID=UPI0034655613